MTTINNRKKTVTIISIIICCAIHACSSQNSESIASPSNDKKEKEYANEIEKVIKENNILKIDLIKPLGRSKVTEHYDLTTQMILYGKKAIAIDSIYFYMKSIVDFKINKEEHLLTLISDDGATYYQRLDQGDLDRMDKRPDDPYYAYKGMWLMNNPLIDKTAPAINRTTLSNKKFDLETLKGKVVYINFWYFRCSVCYKEIPELNKLKRQFPDVEFISIMPETEQAFKKRIRQTKNGVLKFKEQYTHLGDKIEFDIILNGQSLIDEYKVYSYPTNFIIGQDGKIKFVTSFSRYKYLDESRFLLTELLNGD